MDGRDGRMRGLVRSPDFISLVLSILFQRTSVATLNVALPFFAVNHIGWGLAAGITLALPVLPNVVLGPVVGYFVDRCNPRKVAIAAGLAQTAFVGMIPFALDSLLFLQVLLVAQGVVSMFGFPARMALRPVIIPKGLELQGNSWIVSAERLSMVIGPAIVGLLIATVGLESSFATSSVLAGVGALAMFGVPPIASKGFDSARSSVRQELVNVFVAGPRALFKVVGGDRMLRVLVLTSLTYVAATSIGNVFIVDLAQTNFAASPGANGWLVSAMGVGGVIGALLSGMLNRAHPGRTYFTGNVLEAGVWVIIPLITFLPMAMFLMPLAGLLESLATVVYFSEVQRRLPAKMTGLFYATFIPLADAFAMSGSVVAPVLLSESGIGAGGLMIGTLIAVPIVVSSAVLLRSQRPPSPFADGSDGS